MFDPTTFEDGFVAPQPLELISATLPEYALLICVHRKKGREAVQIPGVDRNTPWHGHTFVTLVSPEQKGAYGFYPVQKFKPFTKWSPLQRTLTRGGHAERGLYATAQAATKIAYNLHQAFRRVPGEVRCEEIPYFDACAIYGLAAKSYAGGLAVVEAWKAKPPYYQAAARHAENCRTFDMAVMRGAGVPIPKSWQRFAYPAFANASISLTSRFDDIFGLQKHLSQTRPLHLGGSEIRRHAEKVLRVPVP